MLSVVIVGLAILSMIFLIAGKYHHIWYPLVVRKLDWELPSEGNPLEDFSSSHSQAALVPRDDQRRTVLDDHTDVENAFLSIETQYSNTPQSSMKHSKKPKRTNHVKFKDSNETEMEPMGSSAIVGPRSIPAEEEIAANITLETESFRVLFGDSISDPPLTPGLSPEDLAKKESNEVLKVLPLLSGTPTTATAEQVVCEEPTLSALYVPSVDDDSSSDTLGGNPNNVISI